MQKLLTAGAIVAAFAVIAAMFYLKTPAPRAFDSDQAVSVAEQYDPRIIRDAFGVPHIYGSTDADVAFGLAFAHAEDDLRTIEEVVFFSRGELGLRTGRDGAVTDYLIGALNVLHDVDLKYERDISERSRDLVEAYAAGLNYYCAVHQGACGSGLAPVTGQDVIAGFVSRTPFFYGLDENLKAIFQGDVKIQADADKSRSAFLRVPAGFETGSNAMAVAPSRSADDHTRLMVNSHQPWTGPVAWYEARVKSEEGWDMIGGLFPGAPMILHGAGPTLGWAFTVNKPDLVDVYALDVDDKRDPRRYWFDGAWRPFIRRNVRMRVKLWGPFSLPVTRTALATVHGPAFVTKKGVFAVAYGGAGDIRTVEQWYQMNRARSFEEWRTALSMQAIPSFNVVYADRDGRIAYFYNATIPNRNSGADWSVVQAGSDPALVWRGSLDFDKIPAVVAPESGYVVNANHSPFKSSGAADNPDSDEFPDHYGIDRRETNRGLRIQALYGGDDAITEEEFLAYKFDDIYAADSRVMTMVRDLLNDGEMQADTGLADVIETLEKWDGAVTEDNRSAALAVLTAQKAKGYLLDKDDTPMPDMRAALRKVAGDLRAGFGRVDPTWGEVVRLQRGASDFAVDGGPDTLRAIYPDGDPTDGPLKGVGGDSYILYADWSPDGDVSIKTIHQFGAATLDETSPHFDDQARLFANEEWKTPPLNLDELLAEATADYRPRDRFQDQ